MKRESAPCTGLAGRTVVVTRDEEPGGPLAHELAARGARVLLWPTVRTAPPEDPAALQTARARVGSYDWVVFTSARAVQALIADAVPKPGGLRVAAVGGGTSRALAASGWRVDLESAGPGAVALARDLVAFGVSGRKLLFPGSSLAGDALVAELRTAGADVDVVTAYRTVELPLPPEAVRWIGQASGGDIDAITFASPSAVRAWSQALSAEEIGDLGRRVVVAAIGETTAVALRTAGWTEFVVAEESSFAGLADCLAEALAVPRQPGSGPAGKGSGRAG